MARKIFAIIGALMSGSLGIAVLSVPQPNISIRLNINLFKYLRLRVFYEGPERQLSNP
ncbi:MAG: hypothetical protein WA364_16375 [Candidatus Nitrosopolaris sp.]